MKKILNWTFGSFFRTFGRFIFYILIGILISYLLKDFKMPKIDIWQVLDVQAETRFSVYTGNTTDYDEGLINSINVNYFSSLGLNSYNKGNVYNCSSNSSCSGNVNYDLSYGGIVWRGTMANYGFDFVHDTLQVITTNHLYSYSYNFCVPSGVTSWNNKIYVNTGMGSGRGDALSLLRFDYYSNENMEWLHYDISGANVVDTTNCYTMYNLFNYTGGNANTIKINLKTSSFSNQYIGILGYKLEDLGATNGLTSSQVQNIIDNSGLASASSVNQVQQSVNQVKTELNNVNSSIEEQTHQQQENHEETINTITDDRINENGASDFANGLNREYSSLTPFSDFINLPLRWIQLLFSSQNSCQPINLPLPYLNNKTLTLPCMTEFWQRMGALGTLIQLVWIAIVGVRIFNGLFLLTCETLDPNPDKDMTKLRTWEL